MTMRNRWHSPEGTDPLATWTLSAPAPAPADRRGVVDEVLQAGRTSGVLLAAADAVVAGDEPLPWATAVAAGLPVPFTSRVVVRDGTGALVERTAADAGALLRSLEPLEPAFARRFAAAHPFAAAWSTSTAAAITVTVGFFTTLWLPHGDAALEAANAPALDALRTALTALARRRGGRIAAPTMG